MKTFGLRESGEQVGGIVFFGRMLDKVRLHSQGKLSADYHRYLGAGFDGRVCRFLRVEYRALAERVTTGASDDEVLAWCFAHGRKPDEEEIFIFNAFLAKRGWRDDSSENLQQMKRERGFAERDDIQTFFDFHRSDEQEG